MQQPPDAGNDLWPIVSMIAMYCLSRNLDGSEVLGSQHRLQRILQMLRSSIEEDGEVTGSWPDDENEHTDRNGKFLELPKYREDMFGVWTATLYREPTANRREPVVVVNISPDYTGYSCIAYPDWHADSFEVITGPVDRFTRSSVPPCTEIQPAYQHTVRVQMPDADTAAYGPRMLKLDMACDEAEFSKMSQVLQLAEQSQEQGPQNGNPELATSQPAAPVAPISSQVPVTTAQYPAAQLPEPQYASAPAGNMPGPFHSAYNIAPIQPVAGTELFTTPVGDGSRRSVGPTRWAVEVKYDPMDWVPDENAAPRDAVLEDDRPKQQVQSPAVESPTASVGDAEVNPHPKPDFWRLAVKGLGASRPSSDCTVDNPVGGAVQGREAPLPRLLHVRVRAAGGAATVFLDSDAQLNLISREYAAKHRLKVEPAVYSVGFPDGRDARLDGIVRDVPVRMGTYETKLDLHGFHLASSICC